ncbi:MAG: endonuclease/exonuclease/phosphatase family protein [Bacteroidetes bacterium]|nr:endonuclease/exonuclease/phosphatase family protein [Bacteroidota bacterium]
MKTGLSSLTFTILLLAGCAKEPAHVNQKPALNVSQSADGLVVTLKGSATDADGTVTDVTIEWGDNASGHITGNNPADFTVSHAFEDPATYNVVVTARDNSGDTTTRRVAVSPDFKETSLVNIRPGMFKTAANEYLILTLNLHTYQETEQNKKINMITDVIGRMDVDFISFQECAQYKNAVISSGIIRANNMALVISDKISEKYHANYHFVWNWSHYGWDIWEEGVAVMTKYPVIQSQDRYISSDTNKGSITSRKVIFASCQSPGGLFNIFSAHTHWRTTVSDEEQNRQVSRIKSMVAEKDSLVPGAVSIVGGDFNGNPTSDYPWSEGYNTMVRSGDFSDSFLEIYPGANQKPAQSTYNTIGGSLPGRIDYIFVKKNPRLRVVDSQIIFTGDVVGNVSDHFGVLTKVSLTR